MRKFKRVNKEVEIPDVAPVLHQIIAIGAYCWGRGLTEEEAVRNMKKNAPSSGTDYEVHVVPYDTERSPVTEMGSYYRCNPDKNCPHCR